MMMMMMVMMMMIRMESGSFENRLISVEFGSCEVSDRKEDRFAEEPIFCVVM